MAAVDKSAAEIAETDRKGRESAVLQRLQDARNEKSSINNDHQNCYYYTAPRRIRQQASQGQSATKPGDDRELQTSFGFEVVDDFMSMLMQTFMPREGPWAERSLPTNPDEDGQEDPETEALNKRIMAEDQKVFDLIRASNFYAELAKTGVPDAALGVCALVVTDPGRGQPIQCLGAPIREIDMDHGPDGRPDFRSITRRTKYLNLAATLGATLFGKLPEEEKKNVREKANEPVEVVWAWWRNWENFGDIEFRHAVLVNNKLFHEATLKGEGSVSFIVGRFGATPDFAWPDGPMVKALADMVQLDEIRGAFVENIDFTLRPPKAYEDDGVLTIPEDGIRPGDAYKKRANGGKPVFEDIYTPRPIDSALFEVDQLQMRIKRLHFVDFPEQRGKTPPTATQWIDELAIRQNRIGTPGFAFWREFPYEVFQRFRFLGEERGVVKTAKALGVPTNAALKPYNPAERAQDSQEIATAVRFAQIGQGIAPTMWPVVVDELPTLKNLKGKFRDKIIVFRDEKQVEERVKLLSQLGANVMAQQGGGGGGPAAGGQGPAQ